MYFLFQVLPGKVLLWKVKWSNYDWLSSFISFCFRLIFISSAHVTLQISRALFNVVWNWKKIFNRLIEPP